MSEINENIFKKLAALARLELDPKKEKKLLGDLEKIIEHFEELKKVDTEGIEPMAGRTTLTSVFREDDNSPRLPNEVALRAFPEKEKGFLKIPPVFE